MTVAAVMPADARLDLGGPYKGLAPFADNELDALLFFGRERERDVIVANLIASRLTILYGPSGVGKSSVLRAGVAFRLRELAEVNEVRRGSAEHAVCVVDSWSGDASQAVAEAVADAVPGSVGGASTADLLESAAQAAGGHLYVVFDQFEEYLLYHGDRDGGPLGAAIGDLVADRRSGVNVLLAVREDALAHLDVLKRRVPNLFGNSLRLERLDRRAARAAIVGPVERYSRIAGERDTVSVEPDLVDAVLDQVEVGKVELGPGGSGEAPQTERSGIEAPFLQLVMARIWEAERAAGSRVLRVETLRELGGAASIVRAHVERALEALSDEQRSFASSVFNQLVTPSGTKVAHAGPDLADYAGTSEANLAPVLARLGRERILRAIDAPEAGTRYEIFHDVLADAVLEWRAVYETQREVAEERRRRRRALVTAAVALAGLAVMTAVAIFAVLQRSEAKERERSAQASALAATALQRLGDDPRASLALAVRAAEIEPSAQTEDVLRRALLTDRLRGIVRVGRPVAAVAFSPDGQRLLTGSADGNVAVRERNSHAVVARVDVPAPLVAATYGSNGTVLAAGGDMLRLWRDGGRSMLLRHPKAIRSAELSRDGAVATTACADGRVRIFRTSDGKLLANFAQKGVTWATYAPQTARVAMRVATSRGEVARILDVAHARAVATLPQTGVNDIAFSPDGKLLAVGPENEPTSLWRATDGRRLHLLDDEGGAVNHVVFSPNGRFLATGGGDGVVRVWRVETGDRFYYLLGHKNPIDHLAFSSSGNALASSDAEGTIRVWATGNVVEAGKLAALLVGHDGPIVRTAFAPRGTALLSGSADGTARLWDASVEQTLQPIGREHDVGDAAFDRAGRRVLAAGDASAHVWDGRGGGVVTTLVPYCGPRTAVAPHGTTYASASSKAVCLYGRDGTLLKMLPLGGAPASLVFTDDGRSLLAAKGGSVYVIRVRSRDVVATLEAKGQVLDLAVKNGVIATAGSDGHIRLWKLDGRLVRELDGHTKRVVSVAFSSDGERLVSASEDGTARVWSLEGRTLHVLRGHSQPLTDAEFDPIGIWIVTTSKGSTPNVLLWDARTGTLRDTLVGHFNSVTSARFSFDGRWLTTAGPVAAGLWSLDSPSHEIIYLRGHTKGLLTTAAFSPHGYRVMTASSGDGTVRVYTCEICRPLGGLLQLARRRLASSSAAPARSTSR